MTARVSARRWALAALLVSLSGLTGCGEMRQRDLPDGPRVTYVDHIAPFLQARCVSCHGEARAEGDYRLDSWRAVFGPGRDLVRNAVAERPDCELLVALGRPSHADVASPADRQLLQRWVMQAKLAYSWPKWHAEPWLDPTQRASRNFHGGNVRRRGWNLQPCRQCHGMRLKGGWARKSCYACHREGPLGSCGSCHGGFYGSLGLPIPDLAGQIDSPGARAHLAHARPRSANAVPCAECHVVPASIDAPGHLFDAPTFARSDLRAEVTLGMRGRLGGVAAQFSASSAGSGGTCSVYCHGASLGAQRGSQPTPSWLTGRSADCGSCHAAPMKGIGGAQCAHCHQQSVTACSPGEALCMQVSDGVGVRFRSASLHIDGRAPVGIAGRENTCWGCHGTAASKGAPAPDLDGKSDTSRASVGLHALHLSSSSLRVAVSCSSCHRVPRSRDEPGHIDSDRPAEVVFDDLASGRLRDPQTTALARYDATTKTCSDVYCHSRPDGKVGRVWRWTARVAGGLHCASCHKGKPQYPLHYCKVCHPAAYKDGALDPATHINGKLDFY